MWEITIKEQLLSFMYANLMGLALSIIFDLFRTLRKSFTHGKIAVFIEDVLFFTIAQFITFMLLMARCNGEVRAYIIIGIIIGFFIYRVTVSRIVLPISVLIFKFIIKIFIKIGSLASKYLLKIIKRVKKLLKRKNTDKKLLKDSM